MSKRDWTVVYEPADDGSWSAYALDLPVVSSAATREEIETSMREAIAFYEDELVRQGEAPPEPRSEVGVLSF